MIVVCQLCGGGPRGDKPFCVSVIFIGVMLETARRWLKGFGWGGYRVWKRLPAIQVYTPKGKARTIQREQNFETMAYSPIRIRLKGRCWIEDTAAPATLVPSGEFFLDGAIRRGREAAEREKREWADRWANRGRRKGRT